MANNYAVPFTGPSTTGNQYDGVIFPSLLRDAATYNSQEYDNSGAKGLRVFVNTTVVASGGTLDIKIQNFDPASQSWMDLPKGAMVQITSTGAVVMTIYPSASEAPSPDNDISTALGLRWRIVATVAVAAVTFSIGAIYLDG